MPCNGCHGPDALRDLGEIRERGVAEVTKREVLRSLFADHQSGGLPQRPAVVVKLGDRIVRGNQRSETERARRKLLPRKEIIRRVKVLREHGETEFRRFAQR